MRSTQSIGEYIHIDIYVWHVMSPTYTYMCTYTCTYVWLYKKVLDGKSNEMNTTEHDEVSAMLGSWSEVSLSSDISDQV